MMVKGESNNSIEVADQYLEEWLGTVAHPAKVHFVAPSEMKGKQGVCVYLIEVLTDTSTRGLQQPPLSISLRYLLTTWNETSTEEHSLLGRIVFAGAENKEIEVEPGSLPLAAWPSLGLNIRPSIVLKIALHRSRPAKLPPRVRSRPLVNFSALRAVEGQVLGPSRIPIAGATVTLPTLELQTRTDSNGAFRFPAVPLSPPLTRLNVNARGREISWPVDANSKLLQIELSEDQI